MGEAKRRGTFEERKAKATKRERTYKNNKKKIIVGMGALTLWLCNAAMLNGLKGLEEIDDKKITNISNGKVPNKLHVGQPTPLLPKPIQENNT